VQNARRSTAEARRMVSQLVTAPTRFHSQQANRSVLKKWIKDPDRITAAANTRNHQVGQFPDLRERLRARLIPDHAMEIAHHHRVRMSTQR
jgi:hypothetical protein